MSDEIEWGPWQDHDGKGCPVPAGTHVMAKGDMGSVVDGVVPQFRKNYVHWDWGLARRLKRESIIAYCIRKPRSTAMDRLAEIARDSKAPITAPEGPVRTPEHIA